MHNFFTIVLIIVLIDKIILKLIKKVIIMISFACKKLDIKDLIMCSFDMNKTDYKLFMFLVDKDDFMTTNEIGIAMGLDRSSIQKSIKRLVEKDLVMRSQENLDGGGYLFTYRVKDKELIKRQILDMINSWNNLVTSELNRW